MDIYKWDNTFPKQKFNKCISPGEIEEKVGFSSVRVRALMRAKDNTIHDKKAEICRLREDNFRLKSVIQGFGPFVRSMP